MEISRYLGQGLPVRTSNPDGATLNNDLSNLAYSSPPSVWDKTADPTATDDSDHGYYIGSRWLNQATARVWICIDDTPGAAVWQDTLQSAVSMAIALMAFGTGVDGSIRYVTTPSARWEWLPFGSSTWQTISTVTGKWSVSGTILTLRKPFNFIDVTVMSGTTLQMGASSTQEWFTVSVCGTLAVESGALITGGLTALLAGTIGAQRTTAGSGNDISAQNANALYHGNRGASGGGGGAAAFLGSVASRSDGSYPWTTFRLVVRDSIAATTTVGPSTTTPTLIGTAFSYGTVPIIPGGPAYPGGGGALNQTATGNSGGAGGTSGRGGGVVDIRVRFLVIGDTGSLNANASNGGDGEHGNASGANLSIGGGGGGGGGGSGGLVRLLYGSISINDVDYSNDPYNAAVLARITASGGTSGIGGDGKTRLDDDTALTAWAATTAYSLGTWRRPTTANGYGYVCSKAGTTAGTEPTWPTTPGNTINDGTVTWVCIEEGDNLTNPAFKGGNGAAGTAGVVVIERVPS